MKTFRTAFLHYSAPPVVGGVEAVLDAHAQVFSQAGYPVTLVAGRGSPDMLPEGAVLRLIPEMDTQHPRVLELQASLDRGEVPAGFDSLRGLLADALRPILAEQDAVIVHNIFTKHYNMALTAALFNLLDQGVIRRCLAWCHDFTWTSSNSRSKVFPGYPWDLLRTAHPSVSYVTISEQRQSELAELIECPLNKIHVIYSGIDPRVWFGLSPDGWVLAQRLDLLTADLILLMPVRVTQAKNIELAARVLVELKQHFEAPRLVISGPPDPHEPDSMTYYQELLDLRASLGVEDGLRFVYETGPHPGKSYEIPQLLVAELMRMTDLVFMPSHREGFGMPILEAGLLGVPVVSSGRVPAANEMGAGLVYRFDPQAGPAEIARLIVDGPGSSPMIRFRQKVRRSYTWDLIFHQQILPLLGGEQT